MSLCKDNHFVCKRFLVKRWLEEFPGSLKSIGNNLSSSCRVSVEENVLGEKSSQFSLAWRRGWESFEIERLKSFLDWVDVFLRNFLFFFNRSRCGRWSFYLGFGLFYFWFFNYRFWIGFWNFLWFWSIIYSSLVIDFWFFNFWLLHLGFFLFRFCWRSLWLFNLFLFLFNLFFFLFYLFYWNNWLLFFLLFSMFDFCLWLDSPKIDDCSYVIEDIACCSRNLCHLFKSKIFYLSFGVFYPLSGYLINV